MCTLLLHSAPFGSYVGTAVRNFLVLTAQSVNRCIVFVIYLLSSPSTVVKYMSNILFEDKIRTSKNHTEHYNFLILSTDILTKQRKGGSALLVLLLEPRIPPESISIL